MVQTYTVPAIGVLFASGKSMVSIFNGSGSGRILRIYRIWVLNNQVTAVTGVVTTLEIRRITSSSGGTTITPVKHDTTSEDVPSQILISTGATDVLSDTFRRLLWSNDEPATGTGSVDEMECLVPLNCIWDAGYGDANVEPIVLREGQGITVRHSGTTAVGYCDIFVEFTMATT